MIFDKKLPLVDLHRHLDGNVRVQTIWELAGQHGIKLPAHSVEALAPHVQIQGRESDLLGFLKKLDWMVAVLADLDAVKRVAYENVVDAALSGIDYTELRFSPYYMAMNHRLPLEGVVDAVVDGIHAGVREYQVQVNLIGIMSRSFGQQACEQELSAILRNKQHFVAVDLAGDELGFPGELFTEHFARVAKTDLQVTVHAGEAAGSNSIWQAIKQLGACRIGHGVNAIHDPKLIDYLVAHQIGVESCPTSNLHTSTVSSYKEHPLPQFLAAGVCVGLNTDDPGVSNIDIQHEYAVAGTELGLSSAQISQLQRNGLAMAFLSSSERQQLINTKRNYSAQQDFVEGDKSKSEASLAGKPT